MLLKEGKSEQGAGGGDPSHCRARERQQSPADRTQLGTYKKALSAWAGEAFPPRGYTIASVSLLL